MSIQSEITRISGNVSDALSAIAYKGVAIPSGANSDDLADLIAQITGGGGGLEYEEGTWTPAEDVADARILFSDTHTTVPLFYEIVDTGNYDATFNTNYSTSFASYFGESIKVSTTSFYYGFVNYRYRSTTATAMSGNTTLLTSATGLTDWATSTGIRAYTSSSSRYWRAGRTYKWIAVWAPTT